MKDPQIEPSNHFFGKNFKIGISLFWKQIWILLKKLAEESTFLFYIFLLLVGQNGGQKS